MSPTISCGSNVVLSLYASWYRSHASDFSSTKSSITFITFSCSASLLSVQSSSCLMRSALSFIIRTVCASSPLYDEMSLSVTLTHSLLLGVVNASVVFCAVFHADAIVRL